jgi:hypothetical protein
VRPVEYAIEGRRGTFPTRWGKAPDLDDWEQREAWIKAAVRRELDGQESPGRDPARARRLLEKRYRPN